MMDDERPPDDSESRRPMWDALDAELHREVEDGGESLPMLQLIARKLAAKALDGDLGATQTGWSREHGSFYGSTGLCRLCSDLVPRQRSATSVRPRPSGLMWAS
ncbi:MAG: hypothetical protein WBW74_02310 [Xanthobacteraceae bacterium]